MLLCLWKRWKRLGQSKLCGYSIGAKNINMKLKKIIDNLSGAIKIDGDTSLDIKEITSDSKAVKEGDLFAALKGAKFNGADFIEEAIDRGAWAVLLESGSGEIFRRGATFIYVKDARFALSEVCRVFYDNISKRMRLIGITGTNGKTTITYLIESLFNSQNKDIGVISTVNYRFGKRLIPAINTTPGILDIHSFLNSMEKEKIADCVMEVSSHALEQKRVETLLFDIAIFTNLTREHMDYHKNMEDYLKAKIKLFTKIKTEGFAIINIDDPVSKRIIEHVKSVNMARIITYGIDGDADVCAKDIGFSFDGLRFDAEYQMTENREQRTENTPRLRPSTVLGTDSGQGEQKTEGAIKIESSLIGRHNVYNILAVVATGIAMGMKIEDVKNGVESLRSLPGRLEKIVSNKDFSVYVDYAHTENGLENVLKALRELKPKRLISVFGCGGDRDRSKRPCMGRISTELSDKVFITSDNPRTEEPMDIINEIIKGIDAKKDNYVIEPDRFNAIKEALLEAQKGDIVLLAGKGHETYQIFKNFTQPFDDREVVRRILEGV